MGQKAGHLSLGIGKAAAATITIIPEDYKGALCARARSVHDAARGVAGRKVVFSDLCDVIEGAVIKRAAMDRDYGRSARGR
jgi:hypothetical protein